MEKEKAIDKILIVLVVYAVLIWTGMLNTIKPLFDTPLIPFNQPYYINYNNQVYTIESLTLGMLMIVLIVAWVFSKELFGK